MLTLIHIHEHFVYKPRVSWPTRDKRRLAQLKRLERNKKDACASTCGQLQSTFLLARLAALLSCSVFTSMSPIPCPLRWSFAFAALCRTCRSTYDFVFFNTSTKRRTHPSTRRVSTYCGTHWYRSRCRSWRTASCSWCGCALSNNSRSHLSLMRCHNISSRSICRTLRSSIMRTWRLWCTCLVVWCICSSAD